MLYLESGQQIAIRRPVRVRDQQHHINRALGEVDLRLILPVSRLHGELGRLCQQAPQALGGPPGRCQQQHL